MFLLDPVDLSVFIFVHFRDDLVVRERGELLDADDGDLIVETARLTLLHQIVVNLNALIEILKGVYSKFGVIEMGLLVHKNRSRRTKSEKDFVLLERCDPENTLS